MFGIGSSRDSIVHKALAANSQYLDASLSPVDHIFQNTSLASEVVIILGRKFDPHAMTPHGFFYMGGPLKGFDDVSNSPLIPVVATSGNQNNFAIVIDSITVNTYSVPLVSSLPGVASGTIVGVMDSVSSGLVFNSGSGILDKFVSQLNNTQKLSDGVFLIDCSELIQVTIIIKYVRAASFA